MLLAMTAGAAAAEKLERAEIIVLNPAAKKFHVVDGDSVRYGRVHFRLCGIQAPERGHRLYKWTTAMLRNLLGRREKISAHITDIDKYGRKVAVMFVGDVNAEEKSSETKTSVNEKMVEAGAAYHFRRYSANCLPLTSPRRFAAAQSKAKKSARGLWRR